MASNVTSLRGESIPIEGSDRKAKVIPLIRQLLEMAERGEIAHFMATWTEPGGKVNWCMSGKHSEVAYAMIFADDSFRKQMREDQEE